MDIEAFVTWAMDDSRTVEERLPVEFLVENNLGAWHVRHKVNYRWPSGNARAEHRRQRQLNPAYQPRYRELDLRRALEMLAERDSWDMPQPYQDRPVRNIALLRYLPHLEKVTVSGEVEDPSPLLCLPKLHTLGYHNPGCEDLRFLDQLRNLRHLSLSLGCLWPELGDFTLLDQLETFSLGGNLLALPKGLIWEKVRSGHLNCTPLAARSLRDLPLFPNCEFLTLSGIERLDGIEAFPLLRNLTLDAKVRDFSPLTALQHLTCFTHSGNLPLDVSPLARLPALRCATFSTQHNYGLDKAPPRNYSPLGSAPSLRSLRVVGCPVLDLEVAAFNAFLPPCDDLYLAETPRPLRPRPRMAIVKEFPRRPEPHIPPGEPDLIDAGMRAHEGFWVADYVTRLITDQIGHSDWGKTSASGVACSFFVTVESYEVVERLPEIIHTMRRAITQLRHEYVASLMIALIVPPPTPTPAQAELLQRFRDEQDEAEYERRRKEDADYLERLHLYELSKQEGEPIDPKDFTVPSPEPLPPAPWEKDDDDDDDDEEGQGNFAIKEKMEPPPNLWDNDHPLADNYRLLGYVTLDTIDFYAHHRDLAIHLMQRQPDIDLPDSEEPEE